MTRLELTRFVCEYPLGVTFTAMWEARQPKGQPRSEEADLEAWAAAVLESCRLSPTVADVFAGLEAKGGKLYAEPRGGGVGGAVILCAGLGLGLVGIGYAHPSHVRTYVNLAPSRIAGL